MPIENLDITTPADESRISGVVARYMDNDPIPEDIRPGMHPDFARYTRDNAHLIRELMQEHERNKIKLRVEQVDHNDGFHGYYSGKGGKTGVDNAYKNATLYEPRFASPYDSNGNIINTQDRMGVTVTHPTLGKYVIALDKIDKPKAARPKEPTLRRNGVCISLYDAGTKYIYFGAAYPPLFIPVFAHRFEEHPWFQVKGIYERTATTYAEARVRSECLSPPEQYYNTMDYMALVSWEVLKYPKNEAAHYSGYSAYINAFDDYTTSGFPNTNITRIVPSNAPFTNQNEYYGDVRLILYPYDPSLLAVSGHSGTSNPMIRTWRDVGSNPDVGTPGFNQWVLANGNWLANESLDTYYINYQNMGIVSDSDEVQYVKARIMKLWCDVQVAKLEVEKIKLELEAINYGVSGPSPEVLNETIEEYNSKLNAYYIASEWEVFPPGVPHSPTGDGEYYMATEVEGYSNFYRLRYYSGYSARMYSGEGSEEAGYSTSYVTALSSQNANPGRHCSYELPNPWDLMNDYYYDNLSGIDAWHPLYYNWLRISGEEVGGAVEGEQWDNRHLNEPWEIYQLYSGVVDDLEAIRRLKYTVMSSLVDYQNNNSTSAANYYSTVLAKELSMRDYDILWWNKYKELWPDASEDPYDVNSWRRLKRAYGAYFDFKLAQTGRHAMRVIGGEVFANFDLADNDNYVVTTTSNGWTTNVVDNFELDVDIKDTETTTTQPMNIHLRPATYKIRLTANAVYLVHKKYYVNGLPFYRDDPEIVAATDYGYDRLPFRPTTSNTVEGLWVLDSPFGVWPNPIIDQREEVINNWIENSQVWDEVSDDIEQELQIRADLAATGDTFWQYATPQYHLSTITLYAEKQPSRLGDIVARIERLTTGNVGVSGYSGAGSQNYYIWCMPEGGNKDTMADIDADHRGYEGYEAGHFNVVSNTIDPALLPSWSI